MATFRKNKEILRKWLGSGQWLKENLLPPELEDRPFMELINPLFACLPQGVDLSKNAAVVLGSLVAQLYQKDSETAKVCVRRLIWHMNEESGNIGWGIPAAFSQCLVHSPALAEQYHKVLISYIRNISGDSNFCDHAPLRIECIHAVGVLLAARPEYIPVAKIGLEDLALNDEDEPCRNLAKQILESL